MRDKKVTLSVAGVSQGPPLVAFKHRFHIGQEVGPGEFLAGPGMGPEGVQAEFVAVRESGGDLLDSGLFEVVGQRGLAGGGGRAREDVAGGVGNAGGGGKAKGRGLKAKVGGF